MWEELGEGEEGWREEGWREGGGRGMLGGLVHRLVCGGVDWCWSGGLCGVQEHDG